MPREIIKISDNPTSDIREWYNQYLIDNYSDFEGNVLDIGKSIHWDYSKFFKRYKSIDPIGDIGQDIKANFLDYPFNEKFDLILCNGVYEQMEGDWDTLLERAKELITDNGSIIYGIIGEGYPFHGRDNKRRYVPDGKMNVIHAVGNRYYYIKETK